MKKILLVSSNSIHLTRYLTGIAKNYNNINIITNKLLDIDFINNLKNNNPNLDLHINIISFSFKKLDSIFKISKLIKNIKPDIIHIHQANNYALFSILGLKLSNVKTKTILTTWGSDILVLPNKNFLFRKMVQFNLNNVDVITSDSLFMTSKIQELKTLTNTVHTINFGIKNFPLIPIYEKQNIILSNRLHKSLYNIDSIIRSFAEIRPKLKEKWTLVIAASGDETDNLKNLAKTLGLSSDDVVWTGFISYEELIDYYKIAKIYVSIPSSDATSLSLLESMGYGCYPILSNLPANLEWVIDDFNGKIVSSNDIASSLLESISIQDNNKIIDFNYELIKQKAIFENNIVKFMHLYED